LIPQSVAASLSNVNCSQRGDPSVLAILPEMIVVSLGDFHKVLVTVLCAK